MPKPSGLDDLAAAAAAADSGAALPAGSGPASPDAAVLPGLAAPELPGISDAEVWASMPRTFGSILTMALPELAQVYTEAACLAWGQAMAPVAKRMGWTADAAVFEWTMLATATFSLVAPTVIVIKMRKAAAEAAGTAKPGEGTGDASSAAAPGEVTDGR